jgi:hypothetical protein
LFTATPPPPLRRRSSTITVFCGPKVQKAPPLRAGRRYTVPSGGQYWIYDCSIDA